VLKVTPIPQLVQGGKLNLEYTWVHNVNVQRQKKMRNLKPWAT
jgi:hypothetical protein